jgi:hypothetical protein
MLCAPGRCLNRFDIFGDKLSTIVDNLSTKIKNRFFAPASKAKMETRLPDSGPDLGGNGAHTPDPDLESFKTRLRDILTPWPPYRLSPHSFPLTDPLPPPSPTARAYGMSSRATARSSPPPQTCHTLHLAYTSTLTKSGWRLKPYSAVAP